MQQNYCQLSVLDCFAPCNGDTALQYMRRAALCSRLAKLVRGQARKKLYRLKNANIRSARRCSSGLIEIHVDQDRYFGLLSVRINGPDGVRVHTHENWIDAA
jgi:hypothetical protein